MPVSLTLDKTLQDGFALGSPIGPARLGFFETDGGEQNADNVFVFVAHYDFKGGVQSWPRPGDERDVESLRETFADKRNCRFREWLSPKKEDLLALLADEQKIKRYFASEDLAPSVFILYVLSHGNEDGLIYTNNYLDQYDTFNAKDVFDSLQQIFPESLKFVFLGPCRGSLEDKVFNPNDGQVESKISSRVSFEPRMRNLVILYSTVETTKAKRDDAGTWLVKFSCMQLNKMRENESVVKFLTGVQNRIHLETTTFRKEGQTPEFKINPQDRKFTFSSLPIEFVENDSLRDGSDAKGAIHIPENSQPEQSRSIYFDWRNPKSNKVFRGRRAVIFHQGSEKSDDIEKIDSALIKKFNFETIRVKIDNNGLSHYLNKIENKSWEDYGCFAAFIYAEISEQDDGEICIRLNESEKKPIGELIHGLLGPNNNDWIGKPKLFFFVDQQLISTDSTLMQQKPNLEYIEATNHSSWFVCVIRDEDVYRTFLKKFEQEDMKCEWSLQEFLYDMVVGSDADQKIMLVSTLPHLLHFPELKRNFIQPHFSISSDTHWNNTQEVMEYKTFIEYVKNVEMNRVWLLSSDPGSGKSTVLREIAFELQRELEGGFKVLKVDLLHAYPALFSTGARKKKNIPSLDTVIAHETGNRVKDIQNLIKDVKIIVMFDGFDEICPTYREQVLNLFMEAIEQNVPIWISTRPHEAEAILAKLGEKNKIRTATICPLDPNQQIELFKVTSNKNEEECMEQIIFYKKYGLHDILSNPLHLTMIAEISASDFTKGPNLYEIYEKIVDKKMRMALKNLNQNIASFKNELVSRVKDLEKFSAELLNQSGKISIRLTNSLTQNNGIVTIKRAHVSSEIVINFVHQTFAEFLAAGHYIDCLEEKTKMPFDIFRVGYQQVFKFVVMGISALDDQLDLFVALGNSFDNSLEKKSIFMQIIFEENSATTFNIIKSEITFGESGRQGKFHFETSDDILIKACEKNEEITRDLLEMGAFQSVKDPQSVTIKMLASSIRNNFVAVFSWLEEKCSKTKVASISRVQQDDLIKMSVVVSAAKNHRKVLKLVLEKKHINARIKSQILRSALENNSVETVELLIDHRADTFPLFHLEDRLPLLSYHSLKVSTVEALLKTRNEHPVKLAARIFNISLHCTNFEVAKFLHERYQGRRDQPVAFSAQKSSLLDAAGFKRGPVNIFFPEEVVNKMCNWLVDEFGLNVNDKDVNGWNALHHAVIAGNLELVKYFLQKDPDLVNSVTSSGENVIHLAAQFEHERLFGKRNLTVIEYLNRLNGELILQKT